MYSNAKLEGDPWWLSLCLFKMADFNQIHHSGATGERVQTDGRSHCFRPLISGLHKHLLYLNKVCILSSLSFNFIKNKPCFIYGMRIEWLTGYLMVDRLSCSTDYVMVLTTELSWFDSQQQIFILFSPGCHVGCRSRSVSCAVVTRVTFSGTKAIGREN